jgi:hypothetical protein
MDLLRQALSAVVRSIVYVTRVILVTALSAAIVLLALYMGASFARGDYVSAAKSGGAIAFGAYLVHTLIQET